jgi:hypothetical protein
MDYRRVLDITSSAAPVVGETYFDSGSSTMYVYDGTEWRCMVDVSSTPVQRSKIPTKEELDAHPTLDAAWKEYLVIRKLLGL